MRNRSECQHWKTCEIELCPMEDVCCIGYECKDYVYREVKRRVRKEIPLEELKRMHKESTARLRSAVTRVSTMKQWQEDVEKEKKTLRKIEIAIARHRPQ